MVFWSFAGSGFACFVFFVVVTGGGGGGGGIGVLGVVVVVVVGAVSAAAAGVTGGDCFSTGVLSGFLKISGGSERALPRSVTSVDFGI